MPRRNSINIFDTHHSTQRKQPHARGVKLVMSNHAIRFATVVLIAMCLCTVSCSKKGPEPKAGTSQSDRAGVSDAAQTNAQGDGQERLRAAVISQGDGQERLRAAAIAQGVPDSEGRQAILKEGSGKAAAAIGDTLADAVVMEIGCAGCLYEIPGISGCRQAAVVVNGKPLLLTSADLDVHGSGLCRAVKKAKIAGRVEGDKFVATNIEFE